MNETVWWKSYAAHFSKAILFRSNLAPNWFLYFAKSCCSAGSKLQPHNPSASSNALGDRTQQILSKPENELVSQLQEQK